MKILRIDVVSDVMCPWCIIGHQRLMKAAEQLQESVKLELHWKPFELNPEMTVEGENLGEHLQQKYGASAEQSRANRDQLTALGAELDFCFNFTDELKIVNTFAAHQLLMWAGQIATADADTSSQSSAQMRLKLALFEAYFTQGLDVSDVQVLLDVVQEVGLNRAGAAQVLADHRFADEVRSSEEKTRSIGIQSVPSYIFDDQYLVAGGQSAQTFQQIMEDLMAE